MIAALLAASIAQALAAPTLRRAHVGLFAVDLTSGAVVAARDEGDEFVPASTLKLVTGSVALSALAPDRAPFSTRVAAANTTLYLVGGGDPFLSLADLDDAAAAVASTGVRAFALLAGDATRYDAPRYPPGWSIDDIPYGYAAVPSALSFDENVAHAIVVPGDAAGDPAGLRVQPQSDAFAFENDAVTGPPGSADTTDIERPWDRPSTIRVVGSYPQNAPPSDDLEPAVPDPPAYALDLFRAALARHGVTIGAISSGAAPAAATTLWSHDSADLATLLAKFWGPSDNLLGELLLLEIGVRGDASAGDTRARGIADELRWLARIGVDPATASISDGSGLSIYDRITPEDLVSVLEDDWRSPLRETILQALPLAGVRGTLQDTFLGTPLAGRLYAKTGSMDHVRALAGFLPAPHGEIAFALLIDDWNDASPAAEARLDAARAAILAAVARADASAAARPAF
ncbi:MAG TPA: D-alanyl-D-alanine carboxypeptidase/D-alanyl-D-alanine-endopeptidase [Verrucomicrobiae bacterium]|nr:D-alanyl-D-alanine carboxypeptidase/D-alanyl-D-alanine-endopeptidase [Verrucomicrobiae bacterium]